MTFIGLAFLLLVVSPFVLLRTVLVHLGALPVVFAIVGFLFLLRFFSPTNILSLLHLQMLLNPLRRNEAEQVPVRYFRVRDAHEREWVVRMKGQVNGGNIAPDDLIPALGYPGDLTHLVGSFAARLKQFAFGQDDRPLELDWEQKSISAEETFLKDTSDQPTILEVLWQQATEIESELRDIKKDALSVSVKVRYADFTTLTRQITVQDPITEAKDIYVAAVQLLQKHQLLGRPLRLIGLEVHNLRPLGVRQLRLL